MKFKMIGIVCIVLLAVLTMSAVCATDNNLTDEIISIENTQNDEISLEQQNNIDDIDGNVNQAISSEKESNDMLEKSNENSILTATITSTTVLGATISEPTKLTATNTEPTKLTATKKVVHYVKVGKYKGKLTTKQYNKLKQIYKKNKKYSFVTIKSTNKKYHKITIELLNGYNGMNGKYYKKGFYGSVWDTRYGMDGTKITNKKVKFYTRYY